MEASIKEKIATLAQWIKESSHIVAFTGAGCSTESGLPDFRSPGGLYDQKEGTNYPRTTESGSLVLKNKA